MAASLTPEPRRTWLDQLPPAVRAALEPLTPYERKFVQLYCGDCHGNQTAAVQKLRTKIQPRKRSGGGRAATKGLKHVSYATAASMGSQLLMRPHVRIAVNAWMEAFAMTAAEVTYRIAQKANANVGPFVQLQPEFGRKRKGSKKGAPIKGYVPVLKVQSPEDWYANLHLIKEIEAHPKTGKIIGLKLHDSFAADKELAKILKLTSPDPILALTLVFQQLSDQQVLDELMRAQDEVTRSRHGADGPRVLPAGEPVLIVDKKEKAR